MKYKSSDGKAQISASGTPELVDTIVICEKALYHMRTVIENLWLQNETMFVTLEHGNTESALTSIPFFRKHIIGWLESEGFRPYTANTEDAMTKINERYQDIFKVNTDKLNKAQKLERHARIDELNNIISILSKYRQGTEKKVDFDEKK